MPTVPATKLLLQAIQWQIANEVLVNSVSPFSAWSTAANPQNPGSVSDQTRFGTNPLGAISNFVLIGTPKDPDPTYPRQCVILPPPDETVSRASYGGHVFDEAHVLVVVRYLAVTDWYQDYLDLIDCRDALYQVMLKHAMLPNAPTVTAAKAGARAAGVPTGFFREPALGYAGREWLTWGFVWWFRQEYILSSGFVP